ncbi:MAG: ComEC family competence protein [Candidatus Omnitrophica bacterium]|nr:ComEC family competence protein [Candidatus Omnitrophota bacterium]
MKTHRPLFWLCLAFMAGIVADAVGHLPLWPQVVLLAAGACGALIGRRHPAGSWCVLIAAVGLGGLGAHNSRSLPRDHVIYVQRQFRGSEVALKGVICSDVDVRSRGRGRRVTFTLAAKELCRQAVCRKAAGKVLVNMFVDWRLNYGDEVVLRGKLHRPFEFASGGHLSYRDYLTRRGIFLALTVRKANAPVVTGQGKGNAMVAVSLRCRRALGRVFYRYLDPPEAGLMQAFMLGDRSDLPAHVRELFARTGTAHVVAISGLNIAMLTFMIFLALGVLPLGRTVRTLLTVVLISAYSFLVGGGSPVVRSALMSGIFLLSFLVEREQDKLNTLAAAALVLLVFDPGQLFDVGFQLSFGCVLALLLWTPLFLGPLEAAGWRKRPVLWFFAESLAVSLAAWLGSAGLVAYYFGMVTPVGLLANLPVVPLTGLVTALGAAILLSAFILPPFAVCLGACLKVALNLMVWLLWLCSLVPGGAGRVGTVPVVIVAIYYAVLALAYVLVRKLARHWSPPREIWNAGL